MGQTLQTRGSCISHILESMFMMISVFFSKMFSVVIDASNARQCAQDIHTLIQPYNKLINPHRRLTKFLGNW